MTLFAAMPSPWSREHASQMVFDAHERARGLQKKCDQFALAMRVRLDKDGFQLIARRLPGNLPRTVK
jgi:hypothetical protein